MLPISKLPLDIKGLTPDLKVELEDRVQEFEREYESSAANGGAGYVKKITKGDYIFAGIVNGIILLYYIIAVLL